MPGPAGLSQGCDRLATTLKAQQAQTGAAFIATTDYDTQGEVSFPMPGITARLAERDRYVWPQGDTPGCTALILVRDKDTVDPPLCFDDVKPLGTIARGKGKAALYRPYSSTLRTAGCEL